MTHRIAIIVFPGSNCEGESAAAVRRAGLEPVECLWNGPVEQLRSCDGFFLVGGFSYEDRSRAGIIASLDPVLAEIRRAAAAGKPVLGICNGAQILVETGLVPGLGKVAAALAVNRRERDGRLVGTGFYNTWCRIRVSADPASCAFTRCAEPGEILAIPLAHAEGRFLIPPEVLAAIEDNGQAPFRYGDAEGYPDPAFPANPNGSVANIAALANPGGNILALMPHPERTPAGDVIFASMRDYLDAGCPVVDRTLAVAAPEAATPGSFVLEEDEVHIPVDLIITDTAAGSVQTALHQLQYPVTVERQVLWSLRFSGGCAPASAIQAIHQSGVLYNSNKEFVAATPFQPRDVSEVVLAVEPEDDIEGFRRFCELRDHFHPTGLEAVRRRILWRIRGEGTLDPGTLGAVLDTHIFHNPVADRVALRYH